MKQQFYRFLAGGIAALVLAHAAPSSAQDSDGEKLPPIADAVVAILESRLAEAPTSRIPLVLRHEARCVAVFPRVIKAGVIVAGKRGKGLVACRDSATGEWGPPMYYNLTEASIGLQAGIQNASIMLLIVDDKGLERLLDEKLAFGGDVGIAAGPLGAGRQVNLDSSVVSYVRSEGIFAGAQLGSTSVNFDKESTTQAYGETLDPADHLFDKRAVPADLARVQEVLSRFAPPKTR